MTQQGDVKIFQTLDDGDITVTGGVTEMDGGLAGAAYLSLFGGDEDGGNWWGNLDETDPDKQYNSETQKLLQALAATSGNLGRIEEAAKRDLAWFISSGAAAEVRVAASIPGIDRLKLVINIDGGPDLVFEENWKASS